MNFKHTLFLFSSLICVTAQAQNNQVRLNGKIVDKNGKPIEFATIYCKETQVGSVTDAQGKYTLVIKSNVPKVHLDISYIGHQSLRQMIEMDGDNTIEKNFTLNSLGLSLDEVVVLPERKASDNSNSSIIFDRQAIEQVQAFSLSDVLNTLPGKATTAPNLLNPQKITLRGTLGAGEFDMSNSLGVAIVIDGVTQSNDANMQSRNVSRWGLGSSDLTRSSTYGALDVAFQGIDLRDIPTESIESIEVIQGVASAKYGDMTDGAIIIERQAGNTPFQINMGINGGSSNYALSKGFSLGKNLGALNVNLNLTNSNADPRDKIRTYTRTAPSILWTKNFGKQIKNTLSIDYNLRDDDVKQDPDDERNLLTYSKSTSIKISNRFSLKVKDQFFADQVNVAVSYNQGNSESYSQYLLNGLPKAYTNKDTTGIYEGYYIPGNYLAVEKIVGQPVGMSANINFSKYFRTSTFTHRIGYGLSYSFQNNGGKGIISDPERPRFVGIGNQNERPYSFEQIPGLYNYGLYIEDNINTKLLGKPLNMSIGIRQDWQNSYPSTQPRINARYNIQKNWQLTGSFGVATKAPTLAHRFPSPTWLDIPLLDVYTGVADQSLFLVYTNKIEPNNSKLKPSKSTQAEFGMRNFGTFINTSLFAYYKRNRDGFTSESTFRQYNLPKYDYTLDAQEGIRYFATGDTLNYIGYSDNQIINGLSSDVYGLELTIQTKKIPSIQTSFNMSTTLNFGSYFNNATRIRAIANSVTSQDENAAWYGVYGPLKSESLSAMTKIGTTTHIPKLGFIVSMNADIFWVNDATTAASSGKPIGYFNSKNEYFPIENFSADNPDYGNLTLWASDESKKSQYIVYSILNLSISKEIKKSIRLSLSAYNFLNMLPQYYRVTSTGKEESFNYNNRVSVTAGLSIKF